MLTAICHVDDQRQAGYTVETVPRPSLEGMPQGSLLIRLKAASICGTDLCGSHQATGRHAISYLDLCCRTGNCGGTGHELMGTVVDVVEPCQSITRQQDVLAMPPIYIRSMTTTRVVLEEETGQDAADVFPQLDGGFAQYIVSHESCCVPLPTMIHLATPLHAVAAQPLGTILHLLDKFPAVLGKTIGIVGQGGNGLILTQMLSRMGARHVIVLDTNRRRLQVAKDACGATHTIPVRQHSVTTPVADDCAARVRAITGGSLCDVTVEMVGHQGHTMDLCAALTTEGGTVLLFGLLTDAGMTIRPHHFRRNLKFITCSAPRLQDFKDAVALIHRGCFDPTPLFSHTFPFSDFDKAYEAANTYQEGVIKVLVTFDNEK